MKYLAIVILFFASFSSAYAESFDECTDRVWDEYSACFDKCGGKLGCQRKCVEKKNKDLNTCNANKGVGQVYSQDSCITRYSENNRFFISNKCDVPHRVRIAWYSVGAVGNVLTERVSYRIGYKPRSVAIRGANNKLETDEEMSPIFGGNAMSLVKVDRVPGEVDSLWFTNTSGRHVALTFHIDYENGGKQITSSVVPPGQRVPLYSGSSEQSNSLKWRHTLVGAELEPE